MPKKKMTGNVFLVLLIASVKRIIKPTDQGIRILFAVCAIGVHFQLLM